MVCRYKSADITMSMYHSSKITLIYIGNIEMLKRNCAWEYAENVFSDLLQFDY